jgi:hypothetical protein
MLDPVNEIIRDLIQSRVPALAGPTQVGFEPPDDQWKATAHSSGEDRLNIYLYEIREDLKYRSNERTRSFQDGWLNESRTPERIDCHYLITAWSPMTFSAGSVEPTRDEHRLLYAVLAVLMRNRPLTPADVYAPGVVIPSGQTLASVPAEIRDDSLPLEAALADQIRDLGDFWGSMKVVWRPTIGLTVTIPVVPGEPDTQTAPVTTLGVNWLQQNAPASLETWFSIGGRALTGAGDTPVPNTWVVIHGLSPEVVQVNRRVLSRADGSFIFGRLRAGQYHLRAVAAGFGDIGRDIDIPSPSGEYDMRFP